MIRTALIAFTLFLASCGNESEPPSTIHKPQAPVPVTTAAVSRVAMPSTYDATGTVKAKAAAPISAKIMGYAADVRAGIGDHVEAGQTLVTLDPRDQDAAVKRAEIARDEVRSAMPEADSAIQAAQAQLDLAQVTFGRMQDLLNKRSVTNQEFDEASARFKSAQAGLAMARSRRSQLDAKLAQVEQEIRTAEIQRGYTEIAAPFAGIITAKSVEPGTLVAPGAPLFTIERDGMLRLETNVEESRLTAIRIGQAVTITIDGIAGSHQARVTAIVPAVEASSRTGIVKIDLPPLPGLRSGVFGRATFGAGTRDVLTAPAGAIMERGQIQSVFVTEENVARLRLITLGSRMNDRVEVLSGLNEGDKVIVPIPNGLADGSPVEVRQ